jgi:hypothetical protein
VPVALALVASIKPFGSAVLPPSTALASGPIVIFELVLNASVFTNATASMRSPALTGKLTTVVVFPAAVIKQYLQSYRELVGASLTMLMRNQRSHAHHHRD